MGDRIRFQGVLGSIGKTWKFSFGYRGRRQHYPEEYKNTMQSRVVG